MKGSKITLFAAQTAATERRVIMAKSDVERLEEIRQKQAQLRAREQAILARQKEQKRKNETRTKIIIGGIWLKYFPECKSLNPADEKNFAGVANAIATLANDPQFLKLWMEVSGRICHRET